MKLIGLSSNAEEEDSMGGSGQKALLIVTYEKPHPELHTKLFVKLPFPYAPDNERARNSYNSVCDEGEILFLRLLAPLMPFPCPKFYFGDISHETTNYILIEEAVPFKRTEWEDIGKDAKFEPYEIEPMIIKFKEYELPKDGADYYYALMKAVAQMVCAFKKGECGGLDRISQMFPCQLGATPFAHQGWEAATAQMKPSGGRLELPPEALAGWKAGNENQINLIDMYFGQLVGFLQNAPHIFPADLLKPAFLKQYRLEALEIALYFNEIMMYQNVNPDFFALIHPNLPSDNAYYWRDEQGTLLTGLLDWGNACISNIAGMWNMSFVMCEEGMLREHETSLLQYFVDEVKKGGGPKGITMTEMFTQVKLGQGIFSAQAGGVVMQLYKNTPKAEWVTMTGRWDPKINDRFSNRNYICAIINNLACWKHRKVYTHFQKWVKANKSWFPEIDRKAFTMPPLNVKL